MFPASLLTTLLLVLVVAGKQIIIRDSPITFPVARRLKLTGGVQNLVRKDLARAQALRARAAAISGKKFQVEAVFNEPVINEAVSYIATVGIGIPPTNCKSNPFVL
ncbi:hypothetical protein H0H81_007734 [Sphagnurus paluster]|uniref:Uncharacterized protein n=1 Tax=Sphagnurus paluster TaxID=117069 RepID=A0A9P7KGN1_9AGAR|nr:hypothetical protein H0H81_007734 [Sphagnurus paluster]